METETTSPRFVFRFSKMNVINLNVKPSHTWTMDQVHHNYSLLGRVRRVGHIGLIISTDRHLIVIRTYSSSDSGNE